VLKFGGAGLARGERVRRACRIVALRQAEAAPVVVVSAIGETTTMLEAALADAAQGAPDPAPVRLRHKRLLAELGLEPGLLNRHMAELGTLLAAVARRGAASPAERDHVLSLGERMSARIVSAALRSAGVASTPVDAWDLGLRSDSNHGRARPQADTLAAVGRALARVPGVPVVTGFVAADSRGRLTTLGRSGSDLSAALLAEACGARELELWKTVGGVMSADPRLVPEARTLRALSWSQAAALSFYGAGVVHPDTLAPLERARVPARVLDLEHPEEEGTRIDGTGAPDGLLGLACRRELALLRVSCGPVESKAACVARVGERLAERGVDPLALLVGVGELALCVPDGAALAGLERELSLSAPPERDLASVALVAARPEPGIHARAQLALERGGLAPRLAWFDGERAAWVWVVAEAQLGPVARSLHPLTLDASASRPVPRSAP
jgi:aspartate kinase